MLLWFPCAFFHCIFDCAGCLSFVATDPDRLSFDRSHVYRHVRLLCPLVRAFSRVCATLHHVDLVEVLLDLVMLTCFFFLVDGLSLFCSQGSYVFVLPEPAPLSPPLRVTVPSKGLP